MFSSSSVWTVWKLNLNWLIGLVLHLLVRQVDKGWLSSETWLVHTLIRFDKRRTSRHTGPRFESHLLIGFDKGCLSRRTGHRLSWRTGPRFAFGSCETKSIIGFSENENIKYTKHIHAVEIAKWKDKINISKDVIRNTVLKSATIKTTSTNSKFLTTRIRCFLIAKTNNMFLKI